MKNHRLSIFAVIASLVISCGAQTVPVVALSPEDVSKVKAVHEAMLKAEADWRAFQLEIANRYLMVDQSDPDASGVPWYSTNVFRDNDELAANLIKRRRQRLRKGWVSKAYSEDLFDYSDDWKFILPKIITGYVSPDWKWIAPTEGK